MSDNAGPGGCQTRVSAYAGGTGEEEPRSFEYAGARLAVTAIERRWREPEARWFAVEADGGARYLLECREPELEWRVHPGQPPLRLFVGQTGISDPAAR